MISNRLTRSPYAQAFGIVALFLLAVFCWLAPSTAHASGVHQHYHKPVRKHHAQPQPERPVVPDQHDIDPTFGLTPEQQAVLDWIISSTRNTISVEQAKLIILRSYEQADRLQIDPLAFIALIRLESRFNPHATSNRGAKGLMQVMARVHKDKLHGRSPYDIETSIEVGAQILGDCVDKYPGNLPRALNCYSGGGGRAYNQLFAHFHKQVDHSTIYALFREPDVVSYRRDSTSTREPLPRDESVYQLALE